MIFDDLNLNLDEKVVSQITGVFSIRLGRVNNHANQISVIRD
jgi:hypothetical protein